MKTLDCELAAPAANAQKALLSGLVLGIAGDLLFIGEAWAGPGFSVWILLLAVAGVALNSQASSGWRRVLGLWSCVAFSASALLILRSSAVLLPLICLVLAMCAVLVILQARGTTLFEASIEDYLGALWRLPVQVLPGSLPLLGQLQWEGMTRSRRLLGVLRGLLLAAPVLLLFIALFSQADAQFSAYVARLEGIFSIAASQHLLTIAVFAWLASGLLLCTVQRSAEQGVRSPRLRLGGEETAVLMGSLVILFSAFVLMQASYLFGGQAVIEHSSGLTLAEYARRGFFELLLVATFTLVLLLALSARCPANIFRPLAFLLVACVLGILVSAVQRLTLYIDAFGLSMSRLLAFACMLWLALNLVSFAATCLRGRQRGFASGLVVSGIAAILLFALANPAAVVARVNLDRAAGNGTQIDWHYLVSLGADAVPQIVQNIAQLPYPAQCQLADALLLQYGQDSDSKTRDWRNWNWSEARAQRIVQEAYLDLLKLTERAEVSTPSWPQGSFLRMLCARV